MRTVFAAPVITSEALLIASTLVSGDTGGGGDPGQPE